ncbi:hypothetical protein HY489_01660 [Candidatus Woesearchaeota archaeon]|nr:hypothetical protein [Candidatus Woesearchaeota archaeon]
MAKAKKNETTLQHVKEQVSALNEKVHELGGQTTEYISENPVKSTLTAFAVGVVLGAMLMKMMERR